MRWASDPLTAIYPPGRTDSGRALLVAGDVAAGPVNTHLGMATTECPFWEQTSTHIQAMSLYH